jgi:hypothetical protein
LHSKRRTRQGIRGILWWKHRRDAWYGTLCRAFDNFFFSLRFYSNPQNLYLTTIQKPFYFVRFDMFNTWHLACYCMRAMFSTITTTFFFCCVLRPSGMGGWHSRISYTFDSVVLEKHVPLWYPLLDCHLHPSSRRSRYVNCHSCQRLALPQLYVVSQASILSPHQTRSARSLSRPQHFLLAVHSPQSTRRASWEFLAQSTGATIGRYSLSGRTGQAMHVRLSSGMLHCPAQGGSTDVAILLLFSHCFVSI